MMGPCDYSEVCIVRGFTRWIAWSWAAGHAVSVDIHLTYSRLNLDCDSS